MPVSPQALTSVSFFSGIDEKDVAALAGSMKERDIESGKDIVTQGTGGIGFFVILEGEASVTVDGQDRGTLKAGDHFGETALIVDDVARTATVTARTDVRAASLSSWNFKPFVRDHPEVAWKLLETLARRVAGTPGA